MFNFGRKSMKRKFKSEIKVIDEEISRSQRFDFSCCVLTVEINDYIPRGLSKVLPGKVVSFHILKKFIRNYDRMIGPYWRRYFIVLSQTDKKGALAVKQRIYGLAEEHNWGSVSIGMAVYPDDAQDPGTLIDQAISEIP